MQYIQLFAEIQGGTGGYNSYREIDLYAEEPIKFSRSVQAIEDPQATTSDFSRTFRVPATVTNGQYFKAVFNVNATDYDPTQKANAYINIDGAYFTSGNIRLNGIFRNDRTGKIEYDIVFMGETSNFAAIVAPKNMSQINLSDLEHDYNYANITLSWTAGPGSTGGLKNGDIVYPLCEWGYSYTNGVPNESTLTVWTGTTGPGGSIKGFTNSSFPLSVSQFKPAIRAKKIWDRIFEEAGYSYSSQFLNSMFFQNMYLMSTDQSTSLSTVTNIANTDVGLTQTTVNSFPLNTSVKITETVEYFDANNAYNPATAIYTAQSSGYYQINASVNLTYRPSGASPGGPGTWKYFLFQMRVNGSVTITLNGYVPSFNNSGIYSVIAYSQITPSTSTNFNFSTNLTAGDEVEFYLYFPAYYFSTAQIYVGDISFRGPNRLSPSGLMPTQYKQIEFIKAINDRFKLMWEPDPENPRKFIIEPWVYWIRNGSQKNWSDKLDESKDLNIRPLFYTQSREIVFKDSEESDLLNFSFQQKNKETFGQLNQDSGIQLITGSRTISSLFAPMPIGPLGNSNKFLIPHFAKDTETERQPIQVKPRLVFYNGLVAAPFTWYLKNDLNVSVAQTQYPLISQFSSYPLGSLSFDLNWTNSPQFWDPAANLVGATGATGMTGRTTQTAYQNYWSEWFQATYNSYSRIMEGYFILDSTDIQKLKFNDFIFIKDAWWFPTKLNDYSLGAKQSVKVELVKLTGLPVAVQQTITTSTTTTTTTLPPPPTTSTTTTTTTGTPTTTTSTTTTTTTGTTTTTTSTTTTTTTATPCLCYIVRNNTGGLDTYTYQPCGSGSPVTVSLPNGSTDRVCSEIVPTTLGGITINPCTDITNCTDNFDCIGCLDTTTTTTSSTSTTTTIEPPPTTTTTSSTTTTTTVVPPPTSTTTTTTTSSTTTTTTAVCCPIDILTNNSLDVEIDGVDVDGTVATVVGGVMPNEPGNGTNLCSTVSGAAVDVSVSYFNSVSGQKITLCDSNGVCVCKQITGTGPGVFVWTDVYFDCTTGITIQAEDGFC